ncbi:MAG: OmpH family outer membrane protein [Candidatus Sumerlaeia bacterium]|nr:OmpH family outer membrane protein [Candidatus Sumerlaeia bacterium]
MKLWLRILLSGLLFDMAVGAAIAGEAAPSPAAPRPIRIAYVDVGMITEKSKVLQERISALQQELESKQRAYQTKYDERQKLVRQLSQQETVLTAAQTAQIKEQIRALTDELDRLQYDADRTMNRQGGQIIGDVLDELIAAVERVAKAQGVDLVFRSDALLYASERVDLTDSVIAELDRSLSAPKPAISPAGTPARRSPTPTPTPAPARPTPATGSTGKSPRSDTDSPVGK